jgi:hypothetical protein
MSSRFYAVYYSKKNTDNRLDYSVSCFKVGFSFLYSVPFINFIISVAGRRFQAALFFLIMSIVPFAVDNLLTLAFCCAACGSLANQLIENNLLNKGYNFGGFFITSSEHKAIAKFYDAK